MQSNDLIDFMNSATREIELEYLRIQKRATEDPGTAGDQGEENWATLLRSWLPPIFQIVTKGRILSTDGVASPQVDVIILQPEYPKYLLDKKVYLAGGVLAAFECKITLKAKHVEDFVNNSFKIKSHLPLRKGSPYKELQSPIIYGLLAHSHSWKNTGSNPIKIIENKLIECDEIFVKHPIQMPDLICVADLATWSTSKITFIGPQFCNNWSQMEPHYGQTGSATSAYVSQSKSTEDHGINFTPIGALLSLLLNKLAWEYPSLRSLAEYFSKTIIKGQGSGLMRTWESSIYSDKIRLKIEQGGRRATNFGMNGQ